MTADPALVTGDPDLAPLWAAIHLRLCTGHDPASIVSVRVPGLTPQGIATLRSWLDTSPRRRHRSAVTAAAGAATVPVGELLAVLGTGSADLRALAERATGKPVMNRAEQRREAAALRNDLWALAAAGLPELPGLLARLRATGVSGDGTPVRRLVTALAAVTRELPIDPPQSLPKLAHDHAGDPHFFDLGTHAGACLVAAVAELLGRPEPNRPDRVRELLLDAGIIADRLTATVLVHQVRVTGDGPIDRRLRDSDTPVALTLLDLTRHPPALAMQVLTVVENPSVLEEAMTRGTHRALACTSGQLRAVDHALLRLAASQGVDLRYSGDLDDPGIRIAAHAAREYGARLIAMDAAAVTAAGPCPSQVALHPQPDPEDRELAGALSTARRVLFQEHDVILSRLLQ